MTEGGRCPSSAPRKICQPPSYSFRRKLKFSQLPYNINDKVHKTVIGSLDTTEYIVTDYWID